MITDPPADTEAPARPLWRNGDYILLWSGQIVSTLGTAVSSITLPLLILAITNSPEAAGIAGALSVLPYLLISLPAGALVDRWDRKRVMILCDIGRALNSASIPLALAFQALTIWQIYAVALIEGSLFVFFNLAEVAALPQVVHKTQLPMAMSQNQATLAIAGLIGPALGGFLYEVVGSGAPFAADALSYAVSGAAICAIRVGFQEGRSPAGQHIWADIREGVRWLWHQPLLRFLSLITGLFNFGTAGVNLIVIVLARAQHAGEATIGTLFSVAAVGGVLGALAAPRLQRSLSFGQAIAGAVWVTALSFPVYALVPPLLGLGLITGLFFFSVPIYSVVMVSYRLPLIPDALQGRVNSAHGMLAFGFIPLGTALTGICLERLGATPTALFFGGILLVLATSISLNRAMHTAPRHH